MLYRAKLSCGDAGVSPADATTVAKSYCRKAITPYETISFLRNDPQARRLRSHTATNKQAISQMWETLV